MNILVSPVSKPVHREVALSDVLVLLRSGWWQIAAACVLLLLFAVFYLSVADRRYESSLSITPIAGSVDLTSRIGGLATIADIRTPSSDAQTRFELFLEGLTTRESAERLVARHGELLPRMFPDEWNAEAQRWEQPKGAIPNTIRAVKGLLGMETDYRAPDGARVQRWLKREIAIYKARDQRLTVVSLVTRDPEFGRALLAALHKEGDNLLRERAVARADDYVAYLSGKLREVTVADYRQTLVNALAEQEKTRMMASSNLPFAADPFGPPSTSDRPASPQPTLILGGAIVLGLLAGAVFVLIRGRHQLFSNPSISSSFLHG